MTVMSGEDEGEAVFVLCQGGSERDQRLVDCGCFVATYINCDPSPAATATTAEQSAVREPGESCFTNGDLLPDMTGR